MSDRALGLTFAAVVALAAILLGAGVYWASFGANVCDVTDECATQDPLFAQAGIALMAVGGLAILGLLAAVTGGPVCRRLQSRPRA